MGKKQLYEATIHFRTKTHGARRKTKIRALGLKALTTNIRLTKKSLKLTHPNWEYIKTTKRKIKIL